MNSPVCCAADACFYNEGSMKLKNVDRDIKHELKSNYYYFVSKNLAVQLLPLYVVMRSLMSGYCVMFTHEQLVLFGCLKVQ